MIGNAAVGCARVQEQLLSHLPWAALSSHGVRNEASMANIARSGRRLCAELLEDRRQLAAVTVTTHLDVVDAGDGLTSLREAIQTTNAASGADEIFFDASLSGKTISLQSGELSITDALTVNGLGAADLAISANGASRIFSIGVLGPASGTPLEVTLSGLTIKNGRAILGGGIYSQENLTLVDSIVADNTTTNGPAFYYDGGGAGIYAWGWGKSITTTIIRSEIRNNVASGVPTLGPPKGYGGGGVASFGQLKVYDSLIANNTAGPGGLVGIGQAPTPGDGGDGGGIFAVGSVEIHGSTISNNFAGKGRQGSSMGNYGAGRGGNGGGLYVTGSLSIAESVIAGNTTGIGGEVTYNRSGNSGDGGGVFFTPIAASDKLTIANSSIVDNATANGQLGGNTYGSSGANSGRGGGIFATGMVDILNSTIAANDTGQGGSATYHPIYKGPKAGGNAGDGGGAWLGGAGAKTILNSTISGNSAGRGGGDVQDAAAGNGGSGGGVWFEGTGSLVVAHSTVAYNNTGERGVQSALGLGGGLRGQGGGIYNSVAAIAVTLNHSIVALNVAGVDAPVDHSDLAGAGQFAADYSLIGADAGALIVSGTGNQIGSTGTEIDPLLGPLADNGGPTKTHPLLDGSPALDAGNPALVAGTGGTPTEDQRGVGFARIVGTAIDLGSYEVASTALPPDADFDDNAFVDGNDFLLWQRGAGDADGDTDSDGDDLQMWADAFGQPIPPLEAAAADALVAAIVADEEPAEVESDASWFSELGGWSIGNENFAPRPSVAALAIEKSARALAFQQFHAAHILPIAFTFGSKSQTRLMVETMEEREPSDETVAFGLQSEL